TACRIRSAVSSNSGGSCRSGANLNWALLEALWPCCRGQVNEAVAKAVRELEAKGIKPVYVARQHQDRSYTTKSAGEE
ncbi:hypothetical protein, partial [Ralstonia pseudosolanacearum]|uniref:hypothetical protein n=1 Tax=Ralstonia pseudosolanacearum TaxID=1310165 RepID=UPI001E4508BF